MRGVPERRDKVLGELVWLEPCPDSLLEGLAGRAPGPEALYEPAEAISLAFVTALQLLPPGQRAVLILRDVLGFRTGEVAGILDASVESVTGALEQARAALQRRLPPSAGREPPPPPGSAAEQAVIAQLTLAFETGNVDQLVALLTDDVWVTVPSVSLEYRGREPAARFFATVSFRRGRIYRLIPTRANGQPAFGAYARDPQAKIAHADGLLAVTLSGGRICAVARFGNSVLPRFGLPRILPG